jgi:hypothetical protein
LRFRHQQEGLGTSLRVLDVPCQTRGSSELLGLARGDGSPLERLISPDRPLNPSGKLGGLDQEVISVLW